MPADRPDRMAVWMPPAVSGETRPAASPTSTASLSAKGRTGPPTGISPPRVPARRARKVDYRGDPFEEPAEIGTCRLRHAARSA